MSDETLTTKIIEKNHVTSDDQLGKIIFIWNTSPKLGDSTNIGNRKGPGDVYEKKSHQNWLIAPELVDVFFLKFEIFSKSQAENN